MAAQRLSARPMPTATRLPKAQSQAFVSPNAPILLSLFRILHIFYSIKAAFSLFLFTFARKDLYRQVLKITFAVFLVFSWAGFAYFLKEHSEPCFLKRESKRCQIKAKRQ